ncbi:phosphonopyruvate decarboxylase [Rhizobium sp. BR 314]|uniref:phosphonopyruvate decarboxylase n=1 Tax=Rhizobium sp. BR 314 TaxID=3040013 RepID=UPI0039BF7852
MMDTSEFGALLQSHHYELFSGVPCSLLQPLINLASNSLDYVAATNEGEAVAIATGAQLGGKKSAVLLQNSGLTNALAPLTSLTNIFEVPVTGFVGFRGEDGVPDEVQHEFMGQITRPLLETSGVHVIHLKTDLSSAARQLEEAQNFLRRGKSVFFLVSKSTFSSLDLRSSPLQAYQGGTLTIPIAGSDLQRPRRYDVLKVFSNRKRDDTVLLATTGMCGRELFTLEDAPNNFYMVGSMGCISSIGLGLSIARPERKIIALDGDGALLMRMGNLATNACYRPDNLLHVLLDNETHDSTGGQATASRGMNWPMIAHGAGYSHVASASNLGEVEQALDDWLAQSRLTFLHVSIAPGSISPLGRPTISPADAVRRLQEFMK